MDSRDSDKRNKDKCEADADRQFWRDAMRGVTPLRGGAADEYRHESPEIAADRGVLMNVPDKGEPEQRGGRGDRMQASPQRLLRELRRGIIDNRLDLHGLSVREAEQRVCLFINFCYVRGARRLLIITGRGEGDHGAIRRDFPAWLRNLSAQISLFEQATSRHGGRGAWYVALKLNR